MMLVRYELVVRDSYGGAKAECFNLTNDNSIYVSNKQAWLCPTKDGVSRSKLVAQSQLILLCGYIGECKH